MSLPSHASILTGQYASFHGAHTTLSEYPGGRPLSTRSPTLPELLAAEGYKTICLSANWGYLRREMGTARGFQLFSSPVPVFFVPNYDNFYLRTGLRRLLNLFVSTAEFDILTRRAAEINRDVFEVLDTVKASAKPFFLFVNYLDTHVPYAPPAPFDTRFPGKDRRMTDKRFRAIDEEVMKLQRDISAKERRHLVSQYDGSIAYLDAEVGRLIARLRELDLYDDTLIVVTSDHGEAFGAKRLLTHSVSVYQNQVHVPLIVKYPHQRKGSIVDALASHIDLMPTVLKRLGYAIPATVQGRDISDLKSDGARYVISESFYPALYVNWHPRFRRIERAIFSGPMKLIISTTGKRELYNLSLDPDEEHNLYSSNHKVASLLEERLYRWLAVVPRDAHRKPQLDQATLDRLRSLGYIE